jgi:hypothetical protein
MVSVFNLGDGAIIRSVQLDAEPQKLVVTPNWGYGLALLGNVVTVISVNAVVLKQVTLWEGITDWFAFSAAGDVDCIAFVTDAGRFGFFPAFRPDQATQFFALNDRPVDAMFDRQSASFITISGGGSINVIPHP